MAFSISFLHIITLQEYEWLEIIQIQFTLDPMQQLKSWIEEQ